MCQGLNHSLVWSNIIMQASTSYGHYWNHESAPSKKLFFQLDQWSSKLFQPGQTPHYFFPSTSNVQSQTFHCCHDWHFWCRNRSCTPTAWAQGALNDCFASQTVSSREKYSVGERGISLHLRMQTVAWLHLWGHEFTLCTDYQALVSPLKGSGWRPLCIPRWYYRLLCPTPTSKSSITKGSHDQVADALTSLQEHVNLVNEENIS